MSPQPGLLRALPQPLSQPVTSPCGPRVLDSASGLTGVECCGNSPGQAQQQAHQQPHPGVGDTCLRRMSERPTAPGAECKAPPPVSATVPAFPCPRGSPPPAPQCPSPLGADVTAPAPNLKAERAQGGWACPEGSALPVLCEGRGADLLARPRGTADLQGAPSTPFAHGSEGRPPVPGQGHRLGDGKDSGLRRVSGAQKRCAPAVQGQRLRSPRVRAHRVPKARLARRTC